MSGIPLVRPLLCIRISSVTKGVTSCHEHKLLVILNLHC